MGVKDRLAGFFSCGEQVKESLQLSIGRPVLQGACRTRKINWEDLPISLVVCDDRLNEIKIKTKQNWISFCTAPFCTLTSLEYLPYEPNLAYSDRMINKSHETNTDQLKSVQTREIRSKVLLVKKLVVWTVYQGSLSITLTYTQNPHWRFCSRIACW